MEGPLEQKVEEFPQQMQDPFGVVSHFVCRASGECEKLAFLLVPTPQTYFCLLDVIPQGLVDSVFNIPLCLLPFRGIEQSKSV